VVEKSLDCMGSGKLRRRPSLPGSAKVIRLKECISNGGKEEHLRVLAILRTVRLPKLNCICCGMKTEGNLIQFD